MTKVAIFATLFLTFINIIKAQPPTDSCLAFEGLKVDQGCLNSVAGGSLPDTPSEGDAGKIEGAYAALCLAKNCLEELASKGGLLGGLLGSNTECKKLPVIDDPPEKCSGIVPTNIPASGGTEAINAAKVLCTAAECLTENGITPPAITGPNGKLNCDGSCSGASVLPNNILDQLLKGVVGGLLCCILKILGGGGGGGSILTG